ncbi:MAG: AMP-dependent synthetase/ligase [Candidatus Dormibacteria bacterium]
MARDIAAERREIEDAIQGRTLLDAFADTAAEHADENALNWKVDGAWQSLTWAQYRKAVRDVALGLMAVGFAHGEFGVIMARNRPEHVIADLAIMHAQGTPVSLYNTLPPEQVAYIAGHCEATVAFVEDEGFLTRFEEVRAQLPHLRLIVTMHDLPDGHDQSLMSWDELRTAGRDAATLDPEAFDRMWHEVKPTDLATLIYTSGTTGPPKGVMDAQHQVMWMCEATRHFLPLESGSRHISYLPFAHAFERAIGHWYAIYQGLSVYFCPDATQLFAFAAEVHPQLVIGVPRVWEKLHAALVAGAAAEPDERRRAGIQGAISLGQQLARLRQRGEEPPAELRSRIAGSQPVWNALLAKVGLDQCVAAITGAAPINVEVIEFFQGLGLPMVEGWGMTETTVGATFAPALDRHRNGTVGMADYGVEIRLAADGELLVRGGNVAQGYYREPEKSAETFDSDGWLHTGDVGAIDEDGYVSIVDRKKELIITAGGKNISPANLETLLKQHPLVGQACAIGDRRSFVSALIVLDAEVAPVWARRQGIEFSSISDLAAHPQVLAAVQEAVDECNRHVAQVEAVRKFAILPVEWTAESDELTPTLKMKRRVVFEKYAGQIDAMYVREAW